MVNFEYAFLLNLHRLLHLQKDESFRMSILCVLWNVVRQQGNSIIENKIVSELMRALVSLLSSQDEKLLNLVFGYLNLLLSNSNKQLVYFLKLNFF